MLRRRLGDDGFWRSIQSYANAHRLKSVETADFRRTLERETGRDLERFFYDWTERPGSPVLEVNTEYLPESKQARVVIKQTQAGEPFAFPLPIAFHVADSKPIMVEQDMTEKESTVLVPLPGRPTRVDVDPEFTLLGEIKETKPRELWEAQLLEGPNVAARIRAAKHFAKSKEDADRQLLAKAFASEKFWGVRVELATVLGETGSDTCRDALLVGLHHPDARVRRACIDQLGNFKKDAKVADAVRTVIKDGDKSYAVESAALRTYAREGHKDAVALIRPWLSKPSYRDVLHGAALEALAYTGDMSIVDSLLESAKPGHSRASRTAAITGLTELAKKTEKDEAQRKRILAALNEALGGENRMVRLHTLQAVRGLGPTATSLLPAVEKISREDSIEFIRNIAKDTADKIKPAAATPAVPSAELKQLRDEIERLKAEHEKLRERLNRYERSNGAAK